MAALASARDVEIVRLQYFGAQPSRDTEGRLVYAIGDVHGCYELMVALIEAIAVDAASLALDASTLLVLCGDYVDRGPDSAAVMDALVWLSRHAPFEVAMLKGNHEAMLLTFLDAPVEARSWLRHGGVETLRSYGVEAIDADVDDADLVVLRDALADRLPAAHLGLLKRLSLRIACGDYVFVHAGLRPGIALAEQSEDDLLWIREDFLKRDHRFEKVVVHGHSWTSDSPALTANRIGVDTGAYRTGALTAVRLGGPEIAVLQARSATAAATSPGADDLIEDGDE